MATQLASPAAPARTGWREEARQDQVTRAQIEREGQTARARTRMAQRETDRRLKIEAAEARAARAAARAAVRAAQWARFVAWAGEHVVDLLFVPVISVPALLAWTAMSAFGARLYGPPGHLLPAFSEGAMWAFAAAVTITLRRSPGRPVWHLRTGIVVFAVFGAALNFLHGLTSTTPLFPGLPSGYLTGTVMAVVSVAGVIAHQLITAGPGHKDTSTTTDGPDDETDTAPVIEADSTTDTPVDTAADNTAESKRTPARTRRGRSTADRVATMRANHPDESAAQLAARLKVSTKTVRRYLPKTDEPQADAA